MRRVKIFFNGKELPVTILQGFTRGGQVGEFENKTINIADNDGDKVLGRRIKSGKIEVPISFNGDTRETLDEIIGILNVEEPKKLQFSEQMDRYYLAIVDGKVSADEISYWIERGSIPFLVPDGVAYAEEETEVEITEAESKITYDGTYKTYPNFTFEFTEDNGYIGLVSKDGIVQYGQPTEVDGIVKQKSVILFNDRFDKNTGWLINDASAVTKTPIIATGQVKWDPVQSFVYPTDYGTGNAWHGVTLTRTFEESDNFTLETLSRIQDNFAEKVGRLELIVSASDGTKLFSMQLRDDSASSSQNQFWAYVGDQEVDRDTSTWRWRWWLGNFNLKKVGNLWEWTIQNGTNKWTRQYLDGANTVSTKKASRITLVFAAYGDKKPILWEDVATTKSGLGWSEMRLTKDNVDYWQDLPNAMKAGDIVEIRNTEGKIYKYMAGQEPSVDMLNADIGSQYFPLTPGDNALSFNFSEFMTKRPKIKMKYRKTYL